ncbi:esterase/lipase family protein [Corynebacterium diphtheriae]|uniref:esterase/lipase family protein n=1 Tax=Corynebacterium diphtheriae TaxID=1717 RepID=UPI0013C90977|nr:triacylglycerol lipase [Corynebacterium diphtheriae]MBG9292079.1 triacylglycerol lipase [Corynebacterium diphtheriae bv. gravis]CAB0785141.1 lipase [Corynebacterium diphtheriae]
MAVVQRHLPLSARLPARGIFEDDWRDRPSKRHPYPVILIHGTGVTKGDWMELGHTLRSLGYAVWAPDFGMRSTAAVAESAAQVGAYIDAVLTVTKAKKAIVVGHSQGGILARYWMHNLDGANKVSHLISLAVPHHGTSHGGMMSPLGRTPRGTAVIDSLITGFFGASGFEMLHDSELIAQLNEHGDTLPQVHYSCIATRSDTIIQPIESCFLHGKLVRNIYAQAVSKHAIILHEDMPHDPRVRRLVIAEIERVERLTIPS